MFQTDLLKGRTILITGGGTGLGRAMALRFAELGARLFLVGRREDPLKQTANDIRAKGARAAWFSADIRDFAAVEQALAAAEKEFGRPFGGIDTLVNNAAGNFIARTEKLSPNAFNADRRRSCSTEHFTARSRSAGAGSQRSSRARFSTSSPRMPPRTAARASSCPRRARSPEFWR